MEMIAISKKLHYSFYIILKIKSRHVFSCKTGNVRLEIISSVKKFFRNLIIKNNFQPLGNYVYGESEMGFYNLLTHNVIFFSGF